MLRLLRREGPCDLFLINKEAAGKTRPDYAVCTKPKKELAVRCAHPDVPVFSPRVCPMWWPENLGAVARAVWCASTMGYQKIYLFGADGSIRAKDAKYRRWEEQINAHGKTRTPIGGMPDLVRIWPNAVRPGEKGAGEEPLNVSTVWM